MTVDVAITSTAERKACDHLLNHFRQDRMQEDLCFALWRPSTGDSRTTALINEIILPLEGERNLHHNVSFQPDYLARVVRLAREANAGIAFMHSHPSPGWQDLSLPDIEAERDVISYPARATGFPLVGLTVGSDGYWSARFWKSENRRTQPQWCEKVRVIGPKNCQLYFNDWAVPPPDRREILRRTFDTWGQAAQGKIARLRIGIVGLGSVGCIVAESLARMGVEKISLIDPDKVEKHNLDRLLYGTVDDLGTLKVDLAAEAVRRNATANNVQIWALPLSIHNEKAYNAALDCDLLFSCVDRPVARDVLNFIAYSHLIPVIDGGVSVQTDTRTNSFFAAHWRAHLVTPFHRCLRCNGQYNTSQVIMELDGSLGDPSYVSNLSPQQRCRNLNVFPFSLSVASLEINMMLRYLLSPEWWPLVKQQEYQFVSAEMITDNEECLPNCAFLSRQARGDEVRPLYLINDDSPVQLTLESIIQRLRARIAKFFDSEYWSN